MSWLRSGRFPTPPPDEVRAVIAADVALAADLDHDTAERHRGVTLALIGSKRWQGVGGLELDRRMVVTVAANAAIPLLGLDPWLYRNVHWIVLRPTAVTSRGIRSGPARGVVTDAPLATTGQALSATGPISIAWDTALADSRQPTTGRNVVIHEFAHKLDMSDGYGDGNPPLRGPALDRWIEVLADEFGHREDRSSDTVLRPYAWTNPAEFFAVASEAFFCTPTTLRAAKPVLYRELAAFYHPA